MAFVDFLVEPSWLNKQLDQAGTKILDCTWVMPGTNPDLPQGFIPDAQFFDIDEIATPHPALKHMLPSAEMFEVAMEAMGISDTDHVICYDRFGVRSSPRLWWTFRMFGHEKVSILNGGLPAWIEYGLPLSNKPAIPESTGKYESCRAHSGVIDQATLLGLLDTGAQIVDARPEGRFLGTSPEPRAGLRSGRIPGSISLPFASCIKDGEYCSLDDFAERVDGLGLNLDSPIITTCGSGVTAAGIAFLFHRLGADDVRVYDGSWSEWGASDAPIEV